MNQVVKILEGVEIVPYKRSRVCHSTWIVTLWNILNDGVLGFDFLQELLLMVFQYTSQLLQLQRTGKN